MTPGPVLVTGAAGFIGRAIVTRLAADGFDVRAGVRRSGVSGLAGATAVPCDLDDAAQARGAVADVAAVVHAAFGDIREMPAQCARLLSAMDAERIGELVHLSSIAVYGQRAGLIAEDDGPEGDLDPYGAAKVACEALIRDWAAKAPGRAALILRPGMVYGRGSHFWVDKMVERLRHGALPDLGAQSGVAPLVHVDDVAAAVAVALGRANGIPSGAAAVNLVGPGEVAWKVYFEALASGAGAPAPAPLTSSDVALRAMLSTPAKALARLGLPSLARYALAPRGGELALLRRDIRFSTDKVEQLIGFRPKIGLAEGVARSFGLAQPSA